MRTAYVLCLMLFVIISSAQNLVNANDVSYPVTAWQVSALPNDTPNNKKNSFCMIAAKFDNGSVIRFTGSKDSIAGFSVTDPYDDDVKNVSLFLPGTDNLVSKTRKSELNTIMGKFSDRVAVYNILSILSYNAPITVSTNSKKVKYLSGDIKAGIMRMKQCFDGGVVDAPMPAVIPEPKSKPIVPEYVELKNIEPVKTTDIKSPDIIKNNSSNQQVPEIVENIEKDINLVNVNNDLSEINFEADLTLENTNIPIPNIIKPVKKEMLGIKDTINDMPPVWRANKGEDLRDVLERWSLISGTEMVWAAQTTATIKNDYEYIESFDVAVKKLLGDIARDSTIYAHDTNGILAAPPAKIESAPIINEIKAPENKTKISNNDVTIKSTGSGLKQHDGKTPIYIRRGQPLNQEAKKSPNIDSSSKIKEQRASTRIKDIYVIQKWRALKGSSLKEVLNAWSEDAGVKLSWHVENDYALVESISMKSSFTDAMNVAMRQFSFYNPSPAAKIYFDKNTGSGTVIIYQKAPEIKMN